MIRVGTAAWTIPSSHKTEFGAGGTHLERYAKQLNCVEINSSFYREHKPETYRRWAESTPEDFKFSVKLSRYFTQVTRMTETGEKLEQVLSGICQLGNKFGVLLVQIPPSLAFDPSVTKEFFAGIRQHYGGPIAFEPRHPSWNHPRAIEILLNRGISRVIADPDPCAPSDSQIFDAQPLIYYRLHGSPDIYRSQYSVAAINELGEEVWDKHTDQNQIWCIYDNSALGHATGNALSMRKLFQEHQLAP